MMLVNDGLIVGVASRGDLKDNEEVLLEEVREWWEHIR